MQLKEGRGRMREGGVSRRSEEKQSNCHQGLGVLHCGFQAKGNKRGRKGGGKDQSKYRTNLLENTKT